MKHAQTKNGLSGVRALAAIAAAFGLMVLTGCNNPFVPAEDAESSVGTGSLALTIDAPGTGTGRTIMPNLPGGDVRFWLEFESIPVGQCFNRSWNGEGLVELTAGAWYLRRISAYVPDGSARNEFAQSDYGFQFTVGIGVPYARNVALSPIADTGTGAFVWDIDFPANVTSARMRITPIAGGPDVFYHYIFGPSGVYPYTRRSLNAGTYRVVFSLFGSGGAEAEIGKILQVRRNLESRFADEDGLFANFIFPAALLQTILGAWDGTEWSFDLADGRQITAGHFGLLPVNGVDSHNFQDIVRWFNEITTAANAPTTKAGLTALIDAALIGIAGEDAGFRRANNLWTRDTAAAGIVARAVNNTVLAEGDFSWSNYTVTVTVGGFQVPVAFVPVPVEGVEIEGVLNRMVQTGYVFALEARVAPSDARNQGIRWEIPDTAHHAFAVVESYDANFGTAIIRGVSEGAAHVYAVSADGDIRGMRVTVTVYATAIPITGIAITNPDFTLEADGSDYEDLAITLEPANTTQTGFTGTSSAPGVASVEWHDGGLRVRGVSMGTAVVTVTSASNSSVLDTVNVTVVATPTGVVVSPAYADVPRNRGRQFVHTVQGPTGVSQAVAWAVEPPGAGTITAGGLLTLTGASVGDNVTVRATAVGTSISGEAVVTAIAPEPDYVSIAQGAAITVTRGTPVTFAATVGPADAPQGVVWSIVPPVLGAGIDASTGVLATTTPLYHGRQLVVRASAIGHPNAYSQITVTVNVAPTGVSVTPATADVALNGTTQFFAPVAPPGAPQGVVWSIDPAVPGASVDQYGAVSAASPLVNGNSFTVRATVPGTGFTATATATVTVAPTGVTITSPAAFPATVNRGGTLAFAASVQPAAASQAVTWSIDPAGAGAHFEGSVLHVSYAVYPGTTFDVVASAAGVASAPATVTVGTPAPTGVVVVRPSANVVRGQDWDFGVRVYPYPAALQSVTWDVSPATAGVGITGVGLQLGRLTLANDVPVGTVLTVSATTTDGAQSGSQTVTVTAPIPSGVSVTPSTATVVRDGSPVQFTATVLGSAAVDNRVVWSVEPAAAGSISAGGLLTVDSSHTGSSLAVLARAVGHETVYGTAAVTILGTGDFNITPPMFPPPGGAIDIDLPGPTVSLVGVSQRIQVTGAHLYGNIEWFFDGRRIDNANPAYGSYVSGAQGQFLTLGSRIHGELLDIGTHFLTVEVVLADGGERRSRRIVFTVTP